MLIDTVDVLVNNDDSWMTLATVVDAAVAAGASVVMTSRVAESTRLPIEWERCPLADYAAAGSGDVPGEQDEFTRAVVAHVRFYTKDPRRREDLAARMLDIVARDLPLKPLCLRPLTLRMLFEIYTPGLVGDDVDTTVLYEAYWDNRVVRDRRAWDEPGTGAGSGRDLSEVAGLLATEMLRSGLPEVMVRSVSSPGTLTSRRLDEDVRLLVSRGVGQLAENGVFQFFHQTFFEYAVSRALIHDHGRRGIDVLVARAMDQHDDYFLLAVVEQALMCAGRSRETAGPAGAAVLELLGLLAAELEAEDLESAAAALHHGLRRVVLAVCAQSPLLTGEMVPLLTRILASPRLDLPTVGGFLRLLPAPGRRFGEHDIAFLEAVAGRADNAWLAVIEVLARLLPRDPALVVAAVRRVRFAERAVERDRELANRGELRDFLVGLFLWDPEEALSLLTPVIQAAIEHGKAGYAARAFAEMARLAAAHPDAGDWAAWADHLLGSATDETSQLIKDHAALLVPRLRTLRFPDLVALFDELADRLAGGTVPTTADRSLLGAVLTVAGDLCPSDSETVRFVTAFGRVTRREMVSDLSRGWLVPLLSSGSPLGAAIRDLAVEWLVEGMPTTTEERPSDTRAKVIRSALQRLDLPLAVAGDLAGRAAARWPVDPRKPFLVWTDPGCLLHLIVRSAAAEIPEACSAIELIGDGVALRSPDAAALTEPFLANAGTGREAVLLLDLLLRAGETSRTLLVLEHGRELDGATLSLLRESALSEFRTALPAERPAGMRQQLRTRLRNLSKLLVRLDELTGGLRIAWPELADWLVRVMDDEATGILVELARSGLEREEYPPAEVLAALRGLCGAEGDRPPDCSSARGRAARLWCVWWYARYGAAQDTSELLRLAFTEPVDRLALIKASSHIYAGKHRTPLTLAQSVEFLLEVGRRIGASGLGGAARKDVSRAWRAAMWTVVPGSDTGLQSRIVQALPELDDAFAGHLVQVVSPHRRPEVLEHLHVVASASALGPRLKLNIGRVLDRYRRHSSDAGWPTIFDDLDGAG
ncbi:hypothetical protein HUX53_23160 [Actinomadura sp. BRA 177]|nr:hypothetical protein [Actinomadura sp. BRA 177]